MSSRSNAVVPSTTTTTHRRPKIDTDFRSIDKLVEMLTYRRPHGSTTEQQFIRRFIAPVTEADSFGNRFVRIGDAPILWSAHTDTVHAKEGFQKLAISKQMIAQLDAKSVISNCLGADDGTGCWILLQMIEAQVPGLYIFHRGEECGGLGSKWIKTNKRAMLEGIKVALAFDRKGYGDIITSQGGTCASQKFAEQLGELLGSWWKGTSGIYTDTAEYMHIIPEASNLSVGYFNQHSISEAQDLKFASWLRDVFCSKVSALKIAEFAHRDPSKYEYSRYDYGGYGGYGGYYRQQQHIPPWSKPQSSGLQREIWDGDGSSGGGSSYDSPFYDRQFDERFAANSTARYSNEPNVERLKRLMRIWPDAFAAYLDDQGLAVTDVLDYIELAHGIRPRI